MKKLLSIVLALALTISCFAGCAQKPSNETTAPETTASGGEETTTAPAEPKEVIKVEIPSYRAGGTDESSMFFIHQVERFNEKYKGQYELVANYSGGDEYGEMIKQLGLQGKLPVVFQFSDFSYAEKNFFKDGVLYDMSDWLNENPDLKNVFVPEGMDFVTQEDGSIYALPLAIIRPTGFYYNTQGYTPAKPIKDMTWEELIADLKAQNALYGFQTAEGSWILNLTTMAIIGTMDGGAEMLKAGLTNKITDFTGAYWADAFTKVKELYDAAGWEDGIGKTYPDTENAFLNNVVSLMPNGQWVIMNLTEDSTNWGEEYDGSKVRGDIFPGNVAIANPCTYDWYISGTATEDEIELAKAYLAFISSPEELEAMALAEGGSMPMLTPSQHFLDEVAKSTVMSDFAAAPDADTVYVPYMHEICNDAAMDAFSANLPAFLNGDMTLEDFCKALTAANQ